MIIQVRGTSGSGKSWVVRSFMETLEWQGITIPERKQPLYYRCLAAPIYVLGSYETPCGGCDTIGSARQVYGVILSLRTNGLFDSHVLCEGLLLSEDTKWTSQLASFGLRVIFLTTPIDQCITQIKARRAAAGNGKPLSETNTRCRVEVIERARKKLSGSGIITARAPAFQAVTIIQRWLIEIGAIPCKTKLPG